MIQISQSLFESIVVSGAFWLLDIVIIVLLLPLVLKLYEDRKWKPMREAVVGFFAKFRDGVYHEFIGTIETAIEHPEMSPVEGNRVGRGAEHRFNVLKANIDLLSPSLTPDLALPVIDAYDAAEKLSHTLTYVFDMRARGHSLESVKETVQDICEATERFDKAFSEMSKVYKPRYHVMNGGFGFVKHFLDKWLSAMEVLEPSQLAKPLHSEPKPQ